MRQKLRKSKLNYFSMFPFVSHFFSVNQRGERKRLKVFYEVRQVESSFDQRQDILYSYEDRIRRKEKCNLLGIYLSLTKSNSVRISSFEFDTASLSNLLHFNFNNNEKKFLKRRTSDCVFFDYLEKLC